MYEVISQTLERCAEVCDDLVPPVYRIYFDLDPQAKALMAHSDQHMKGRMLQQTLELMLTDEHLGEAGYLRWEVNNHLLAYGVDPSMYKHFLDAIKLAVQESLGESWQDTDEAAWQQQLALLLGEIQAQARVLGKLSDLEAPA